MKLNALNLNITRGQTFILQICALVLQSTGNNFKCLDRKNYINTFTASSSGKGNERAQLNLGTITNASEYFFSSFT